MKNVISISDARKGLPRLIREIQRNPHTVFQISVRKEPIAEIRSANPMVRPGEAVNKLIRLRKRLSRSAKGKDREPISQRTKDYLYAG
ncbi:MAG: hypothetical protein OEW45_20240 [Deltaproteobacteria bacterium]|nr:hypothetical protein [Deltaproteobacteria bacterium]